MSWSVLGSLGMALAVICGAFGAHGLRDRLTPELLAVWETAARYQVYHSLALFAVDLMPLTLRRASPAIQAAGWLFLAGMVLFCGSLYALALSGRRWLGAITPLGGLAWILAWLVLAYAAWTGRAPS